MKISILHPSRSRPFVSRDVINMWLSAPGVSEIELIVSVDEDDKYLSTYQQLYGDQLIINKNKSAVDAINKAAEKSTGDLLVVVSDDTHCHPGWATKILKAVAGKSDFVLKVNDGIQDWLITQPILDRVYYNRFGYVYHPSFRHMFADTYFTHVADVLRRIIWRNDLKFPHKHYSVTKQRPDMINKRADATWNEGKHIYIRMLRENLGLPAEVDIMNLSNEGRKHIQWIRHNTK